MEPTTSWVTADRAALGIVLVAVVVGGPHGVGLVATGDERLGNGTATVTVLEPSADELRVTGGRFGTGIQYVRLPDLVVDVERYEGTPRVQYTVAVPGLGVKRTTTELVTSTGRRRVRVDDHPLPERPEGATHSGYVRVRVQSLSAEKTVVNRSVEVVVE